MRLEKLYLQDIVEAAEAITAFIGSNTREVFMANDMLQSAVLQKLLIVGEAAAHLSQALRQKNPEVHWSRVIAFRNFAIHAYFSIDLEIVWQAATKDAPELKEIVSRILAEEFPDDI